MAVYSVGILLVLETISLTGIVTNLVSAWYIANHFDTSKIVFLLLLFDATISCFGCSISFCAGLFLPTFSTIPCNVAVTTMFITNVVGFAAMTEISVIRLYSLRLSLRNHTTDEKRIRKIALLFLVITFTYPAIFIFTHNLTGIPYSNLVETCIHEQPPELPTPATLPSLVVPSMIVNPIVSIISDAAIVWTLRKRSSNNKSITSSFDSIPIRATVVSTMTLAAASTTLIFLQFSPLSSKLTSSVTTQFTGHALLAIRCPVATFVCFAYKNRKEQQSRRVSRETRLMKVIMHAKEERAMRMSGPIQL